MVENSVEGRSTPNDAASCHIFLAPIMRLPPIQISITLDVCWAWDYTSSSSTRISTGINIIIILHGLTGLQSDILSILSASLIFLAFCRLFMVRWLGACSSYIPKPIMSPTPYLVGCQCLYSLTEQVSYRPRWAFLWSKKSNGMPEGCSMTHADGCWWMLNGAHHAQWSWMRVYDVRYDVWWRGLWFWWITVEPLYVKAQVPSPTGCRSLYEASASESPTWLLLWITAPNSGTTRVGHSLGEGSDQPWITKHEYW